MNCLIRGCLISAWLSSSLCVHAQETLQNRGHDPFFQISSAIAECPEPAGPRISEEQWLSESHHRIEHGNHCWLEGRCRLPNAFEYHAEIAESTQRRLQWLASTMPMWQQSSLWITVYQRWIVVQGCTTNAFPRKQFFDALGEIPDAERIVDQTTATFKKNLPYIPFH
jgi:hypothetical protein